LVEDMKMLRQYATLWYLRFTNKIKFPDFVTKSPEFVSGMTWLEWLKKVYRIHEHTMLTIDYKHIGPLCDDDCLLDAIDMYCSPILTNLLADMKTRDMIHAYLKESFPDQEITEDFMESELKKMIWWFRSSVNNKHNIAKENEQKNLEEDDEKRKLESLFDKLRMKLDTFAYWFYRNHMSNQRAKNIS
jgi:hypothetical protein